MKILGKQFLWSEAYLEGASGHGPFGQNFFADIEKNLKTWFAPPLYEHYSGQRKFGPTFRNPKYATAYDAETWKWPLIVKDIATDSQSWNMKVAIDSQRW